MKQPKTKAELTALLMDEIRRVPECGEITDVAIIALDPREPHEPNWDVAWLRGKESRPQKAEEIVRRLQGEVRLVE